MQNARDQYLSLMTVVRRRLDAVRAIRETNSDPFSRAEIAAFHGRKIIEATAFGVLIAIENGLKTIPRDAKGQWNADAIFGRLCSKKINVFPSPSIIRNATDEEKEKYPGVKVTIEGQPALRLDPQELRRIYSDTHKWLHEVNPYVEQRRESFLGKHGPVLWSDLDRLEAFIERHTVSIAGETLFCVLRDKHDGMTKVLPLSKLASIS